MKPEHLTEISKRFMRLKMLAEEYFALPDGALIEFHLQLLRIFDIRRSKHGKSHPHNKKWVCISRRSLKHYVESRRKELLKNHPEAETLNKILFGIENIKETIADFDKYELEPPSHAYSKDYSNIGFPSLRIMLDLKGRHLEIRSIHFTKTKKRLPD